MIVVPKGMSGALKLVAVDLSGQRAEAKLRTIERYLSFARKHRLVTSRQEETVLVEMLLGGVKFDLAIAELRSARPV
jgi:hypothetical protein